MVLFIIGLMGIISFYTNRLIDYLKENVQVVMYFNTGTPEEEVKKAADEIAADKLVKKTVYVSSAEAAALFKDELGDDFTEVLGGNPLPPAVEIYLEGENLNRVALNSFVEKCKTVPKVYEVTSQGDLIDEINRNKTRVTYIFGALGIILLLVATALMNNTVRLAVYSKRFIIKSMQLVGATEWFITKPFIRNSAAWVFTGAIIATIMCVGVFYYTNNWLTQNIFTGGENWINPGKEAFLSQLPMFGLLFAFLLLIGWLVIIPGTFWSTKKYLSSKIDDLY